MGVPPYSARGLEQILEPIDASIDLQRSINGALLDLGNAQFQKYRSSITGADQQPPAVDGVWPGQVVTVDCIVRLPVPEYGSAQRDVVPGSEHVDGEWSFYRPRLVMMVTRFSVQRNEYGAVETWTLELEEV
jgi:hypothetical protein